MAGPLSLARIRRTEEFFLDTRRAQVYAGDTALHAAAFAYDTVFARRLVESRADVRARNRRGGEPLHAATTIGGPAVDPHPGPLPALGRVPFGHQSRRTSSLPADRCRRTASIKGYTIKTASKTNAIAYGNFNAAPAGANV
jgi:hypothetical protein